MEYLNPVSTIEPLHVTLQLLITELDHVILNYLEQRNIRNPPVPLLKDRSPRGIPARTPSNWIPLIQDRDRINRTSGVMRNNSQPLAPLEPSSPCECKARSFDGTVFP